jgi:RHS repeat-associated protein
MNNLSNWIRQKWVCVLFLIGAMISSANAYYQPESGRFMQRDPLGVNPGGGRQNPFSVRSQYNDGANVYEYVKSSPVKIYDSYGLSITPRSDSECCMAATRTPKTPFDEQVLRDLEDNKLPKWGLPDEEAQRLLDSARGEHCILNPKVTNATICCDGRKVSCPLGAMYIFNHQKFNDFSEGFAGLLKVMCVDTHERTHFNHTPPCPKKCERYVSSVESYKDVTDKCNSEYEAYQSHISCLEVAKNLCNITANPEKCQKIIQDDIESQKRTFNNMYSQGCTKTPGKF